MSLKKTNSTNNNHLTFYRRNSNEKVKIEVVLERQYLDSFELANEIEKQAEDVEVVTGEKIIKVALDENSFSIIRKGVIEITFSPFLEKEVMENLKRFFKEKNLTCKD